MNAFGSPRARKVHDASRRIAFAGAMPDIRGPVGLDWPPPRRGERPIAVDQREFLARTALARYSGFSGVSGASDDDGPGVACDVSAGWANILRRLALRDLAAPTGAGTARNSARSNFGLMENMVIEDAFHGRRLSRLCLSYRCAASDL